jgi:hypothetical protein
MPTCVGGVYGLVLVLGQSTIYSSMVHSFHHCRCGPGFYPRAARPCPQQNPKSYLASADIPKSLVRHTSPTPKRWTRYSDRPWCAMSYRAGASYDRPVQQRALAGHHVVASVHSALGTSHGTERFSRIPRSNKYAVPCRTSWGLAIPPSVHALRGHFEPVYPYLVHPNRRALQPRTHTSA